MARLHAVAEPAEHPGLADRFAVLADGPSAFPGDPQLADAVCALLDEVGAVPRDRQRYGVVHGDFELDNLSWIREEPVAFDFDDAALSWFVADIAFAIRDLQPLSTGSREAALFEAFLEGYRGVRAVGADELALLPLFDALHAASTLHGLDGVLDAGTSDADPPWLRALRAKLDGHRVRLRAAVLAGGR